MEVGWQGLAQKCGEHFLAQATVTVRVNHHGPAPRNVDEQHGEVYAVSCDREHAVVDGKQEVF